MSRCVQFHHLYDKDAEACGMSPQSESYYKRYREAVRKLTAQKIDEDFIYENFKEGAYRVILSMKNADTQTDALSYVSECLHNQEKVTDRDLKGWLKVWRIEHGEPEKSTNVKGPIEQAMEHAQRLVDENILKPLKIEPDHINPGPAVMVSPVVINDTYRERPFKTGAEVQAHDKDPLGIDKPITTVTTITTDPKAMREEMERRAVALLELMPKGTQLAVSDYLRQHPSKKVKDAFYDGIEALANPPKVSVAPSGRRP